MLLKQLKQLTFSAPLRNAAFETDVERLARFYCSTALSHSLKPSKAPKKLSRNDRRAAVESFVSEYIATNAGKFPSLNTIYKEVGGSYYVVREIFQELKLKPVAPLPIVAKALSEVSASVANDADADPQSHISACDAKHLSAVAVDLVLQAGSSDTIETGSDQMQTTVDVSHPHSDEPNLEGNNLVVTATHDKRETEIAPNNDVDSKMDSNVDLPESQESFVLDEFVKNSETKEEGNLIHLGSQEPKENHFEGAVVSANAVPTETRQVSEKEVGNVEKRSSAWSDIMSFAKGFANLWRKW